MLIKGAMRAMLTLPCRECGSVSSLLGTHFDDIVAKNSGLRWGIIKVVDKAIDVGGSPVRFFYRERAIREAVTAALESSLSIFHSPRAKLSLSREPFPSGSHSFHIWRRVERSNCEHDHITFTILPSIRGTVPLFSLVIWTLSNGTPRHPLDDDLDSDDWEGEDRIGVLALSVVRTFWALRSNNAS